MQQDINGVNGANGINGVGGLGGINDIHDIRPPVQVGMDPVFLKIALIVLLMVALCGLIFFLYRYFKKKKTRPDSTLLLLPPPLPAREAALKDLECLGDLISGNPRLYYFRLTEIMKRFAGKHFNIRALEMNTQEFISFLKNSDMEKNGPTKFDLEKSGPAKSNLESPGLKKNGLDRELFSETRQFLLFSDTIKYAGMTPSHQVLEGHLAFVKTFVNKVSQQNTQQDTQKATQKDSVDMVKGDNHNV